MNAIFKCKMNITTATYGFIFIRRLCDCRNGRNEVACVCQTLLNIVSIPLPCNAFDVFFNSFSDSSSCSASPFRSPLPHFIHFIILFHLVGRPRRRSRFIIICWFLYWFSIWNEFIYAVNFRFIEALVRALCVCVGPICACEMHRERRNESYRGRDLCCVRM